MSYQLRRIAVVGSGIAAWISAAWMARLLKRQGTEVVIVPDGEPGAPPVLAALPSIDSLHQALGFDLRDLLRAASGNFRLGTLNEETGGIHAYGDTGAPFGSVPFHLAWRAHAQDLSPAAYGSFSLAAQAARAGKFAPPLENGPPGSLFSPGLHLDGAAYLAYLQRAALHYGVIPAASLADWQGLEERGLQLSDGSSLQADLIIDTVARGVCGDPLPGLPSQIYIHHGRKAASPPLGLSVWRAAAGSRALDTPMADALIRTVISQGEAAAHRASSVLRREGFERVGPTETFAPMAAHDPWQGRLVRIGAAACRLPPVEGVDLRIIQAGLETLGGLLPGGSEAMPERAEYNRQMREIYQALADFAALSFIHPGAIPDHISPTLQLRLENFTSRGRIILTDGESFSRESWVSALIAAGWKMDRADAHAAALPPARVAGSLISIAGMLAASCETLPDQRTFLRKSGFLGARAGAG